MNAYNILKRINERKTRSESREGEFPTEERLECGGVLISAENDVDVSEAQDLITQQTPTLNHQSLSLKPKRGKPSSTDLLRPIQHIFLID